MTYKSKEIFWPHAVPTDLSRDRISVSAHSVGYRIGQLAISVD